MSYLVLARKYRPQTFSEVIGQEHVTRTLQNAIERGRIHHAFLFCGGRGTGKTTTARILAKALSCEQAPTATPCNKCQACVEITAGTSVDVQEIDAASQNKVEDIRDLREAIRYAPVRGKKKLYILDEVHMLSTSAFNALLKTLEEPPPHAVFVFATTDPHKLPQTILSRVQRYDFKLVPTARLVEHLQDVLTREGIECERSALQLVAREGAGSVRDALSLLDQVLASCHGKLTEEQAAAILGVADRGLILELGRAIVGRDPAAALHCIDAAYGRGYDLGQLSRALVGHLRDLVVVNVVKEPGPLLEATGSELEELSLQARQAGAAAELLFDRMVRIAEDTARAALPRYVLEVGVVELCHVEPLQPFEELVARLESLEGGLGGEQGPQARKAGGVPATPAPRAQPAQQRPAPHPTPLPPAGEGAAPRPEPRPAPVRTSVPPAEAQPEKAPVARQEAPAARQEAPARPQLAADPGGKAPPQGERDFTQLVEGILRKAPLLGGIAMGRPLRWDEGRLVIAFDTAFVAGQVRDKLPQLRRLAAEELGHEIDIEIQVAEAAPGQQSARGESLIEVEQRKKEEDHAARRREALGHPARKMLTEAFGEDISFQEPEME